MNGAELKEALLQRYPVVCNGITYSYISAIIYRKGNSGIAVSAEMWDANDRSVTIASAEKIEKEIANEVHT